MTQQAVERALGKLITDEAFRERFFAAPIAACLEAGLTLSAAELEALSRLSPEQERDAPDTATAGYGFGIPVDCHDTNWIPAARFAQIAV